MENNWKNWEQEFDKQFVGSDGKLDVLGGKYFEIKEFIVKLSFAIERKGLENELSLLDRIFRK